jgi:hypothetical protein
MNHKMITLLVLGALATTAHAQQSDKPAFFKASVLRSFADLTDYNGGRRNGFGFEMGYDFAMPDNFSGITPWVGFIRFNGDPRQDLAYLNPGITPPRFDLTAWRAGLDFKWNTPVKNLKGWMGINVNYFDGNQLSAGRIPTDTSTLAKPLAEAKAKLGMRAGLDYNITKEWSAHVQYDAGYWLASSRLTRFQALNPMFPSWFSVSAGYHF